MQETLRAVGLSVVFGLFGILWMLYSLKEQVQRIADILEGKRP